MARFFSNMINNMRRVAELLILKNINDNKKLT